MKKTTAVALLIAVLCACTLASAPAAARRLYYAEEFYLYVMNLYHTNPNLERNVRFLQWALKAPFDNPVRSLALIRTENDFDRYRALFRMHVNMLIIDSTLQLGRRFDKQYVTFFNLWYAESLRESFAIARYHYETALNYWVEVKKQVELLDGMQGRLELEAWEDEFELIRRGEFDYEAIIRGHLERLEGRAAAVDDYLARLEGREDPGAGGP